MPTDILERKLAQLQRYADRLEALSVFLSENPTLAPLCAIKQVQGGVALFLDDKAIVRALGRDQIQLRLERDPEMQEHEGDRVIHEDLRGLSQQQLAAQLARWTLCC